MWCPPGVEGYWVQAPGAASERVGVMLHGGGYTMGSAKGYRAYAAEVSRVTKERVFVPEYRLARDHPFSAAIKDARSVLSAVMEEVGSQSCFAIRDSAGGGWCGVEMAPARLAEEVADLLGLDAFESEALSRGHSAEGTSHGHLDGWLHGT